MKVKPYDDREVRRDELLTWMSRPEHQGLTAREIGEVSGLYDHHANPAISAYGDLTTLAGEGRVRRDDPLRNNKRWWLA